MRVWLVIALVGALACQQGPKGETGLQGPKGETGMPGPKGDQGIAGTQGATGERGPQGEQGPTGQPGIPGQAVVLTAGDGGSLTVNGNIAVVTGPQGVQGATGAQGQVGGAGPSGLQGPAGPPGVRVLAADGGLLGFLTGADFWSQEYGCFIGLEPFTPDPNTNIRTSVCFTNPDCTGTPYFQGATTNVATPFATPVFVSCSPVGRCFLGSRKGTGSFLESFGFRLSGPYVRETGLSLYSCSNGNQCVIQSPPVASGYAVVLLNTNIIRPLVDQENWRIEMP